MEKGTIFETEISHKKIQAVVVDTFSGEENEHGDLLITNICYTPDNHLLFYYYEWVNQGPVVVGIDEFGDDILEWQTWTTSSHMGKIFARAYLPNYDEAMGDYNN